MMNLTCGAVWLAFLGVVPMLNAGQTIGTVVTPGRMLVNNLAVEGNAIVADGALLKTSSTAARLDLSGGVAVSLDAQSEAVALPGRMQLRLGKGMLISQAGRIEALGLLVAAGQPHSRILVAVQGGKIEVAALQGSAKVSNQQGILLAKIHKDRPLSFQPGPGKPVSTVTGTLRRQGPKLFVRDELTDTDIELQGNSLAPHLGHRIQASGESLMIGDSPSHTVLVSRLNRLDDETVPEPASPASDSTASTAKTGMSAGTKIGLAALTFGGMAAAIAVPLAMSN